MMVAAVVVVAYLVHQRGALARQSGTDSDPGNWYGDQWQRLHAADLFSGTEHPQPSGFDLYGRDGQIVTSWPSEAARLELIRAIE